MLVAAEACCRVNRLAREVAPGGLRADRPSFVHGGPCESYQR